MPIPLVKRPGTDKKRKRKGRGISAGQGKTAGRGMKGQGARSGENIPPRFEGGRMPVIRQMPKRGGFIHHRKIYYHAVNIKDLLRLPEDVKEITPDVLRTHGICPRKKIPVKILGDGELSRSLTVKAHAFSKTAREKIESAGGRCEVIKR